MAFLLTNSQSHVIPHTHPTSDINGLTELIQANAVVVSATAPENPTSGKLWYNTTKDVFNIYNGSSWILVGPEVTPITKAQYDALSNDDKNDGRFYLITDNDGTIIVDWANVENKPTIPTSLGELSGTSDDITEGSSHLFMTSAERTNLGNQSGVNTGDQSASDFDIKDLADTTNLRSTWSGKQDAISDLATIRSGASAGATAVQPDDNVSILTNDAGYITNAVNDLANYYTKTQTYTKTEVDQMISKFGGFEVVEQLPAVEAANTHIIYLLGPIGTGGDRYEEWIVTTSEEEDPDTHETVEVKTWTKIGETSVDLSNYFNTFTDTADSINNGTNHLFVSPSEKSTWSGKQDALVSGTNIKTINGTSVLGSGDIVTPDTTYQAGNGIDIANDEISIDYDTVAGALAGGGLGDYDGQLYVYADGLAGNGLYNAGSTVSGNLSVDYNTVAGALAGTGLTDNNGEIDVDYNTVAGALAGDGLRSSSGLLYVDIYRLAGTGLEGDGSSSIDVDFDTVAGTLAGNGLTANNGQIDVDGEIVNVGDTAPSNPTEGMVWYDTTNDVLKTYDGTNWNATGTTYTAGNGIDIDADNEISVDANDLAGIGLTTEGSSVNGNLSVDFDTVAGVLAGIGLTTGGSCVSGNLNVNFETVAGALAGNGLTANNGQLDVDGKTVNVGTTSPSNPTEGQVWYDTTNDILKVYDGTNWNATGKTYEAGNGINIFNDEISIDYLSAAYDLAGTGLQTESSVALAVDYNTVSGALAGTGLTDNNGQIDVDYNTVAGALDGDGLGAYNGQLYVDVDGLAGNGLTNGGSTVGGNLSVDYYTVAGALAGNGLTNNNGEIDVDSTVVALKTDLSNYYTKSETYTKTEVDNLIANVGSFEVVATLPSVDTADTKKIYLLGPIGTGADKYEEYIVNQTPNVIEFEHDDENHSYSPSTLVLSHPTTLTINEYVGEDFPLFQIYKFNQAGTEYDYVVEFWTSGWRDCISGNCIFVDANSITVPAGTYQLGWGGAAAFTSISFTTSDINKSWTKIGETSIDLSNYATTTALTNGLATKQDTLTAGQGIYISSNNVISVNGNTIYVGSTAPTQYNEYDFWFDTTEHKLKSFYYSVWTEIGGGYTAGTGINISASNVISTNGKTIYVGSTEPTQYNDYDFWYDTTDGKLKIYYSSVWTEVGGATYTAGNGINIRANNEISVDASDLAGTGLSNDSTGTLGVNYDTVASALAGDGLTGSYGQLEVDIDRLAGTGLQSDGSSAIDVDFDTVAGALAGIGLTTGGSCVGGELNVDFNTVAGALAGNGLTANNGQLDVDGIAYTAGKGISIGTTQPDTKGPAPEGFHVPLVTEWQAVVNAYSGLGLSGGNNFKKYLKIPFAGYREFNTSSPYGKGSYGYYWSSSSYGTEDAYTLSLSSYGASYDVPRARTRGYSLRCFKDSPVTPDNSWTTVYQGSGNAGIFHNATDGLISISSDGTTWYTIQDKNLGATTVYNNGNTLSEANCGKYFQRGNNYGFPWNGSVTTSSTKVDATSYRPGNYYSSNIYITGDYDNGDWSSVQNDNLRGGVSQGTWIGGEGNIIANTGVITVNGKNGNITGLQITANLKTDLLDNNDSYYPSQKAVKTALDAKQNKLDALDGISIGTIYPDRQGPAPYGFHVPLEIEWQALVDAYEGLGLSSGDDFKKYLKIPLAGRRYYENAAIQSQGETGFYWSSSVATGSGDAIVSHSLYFGQYGLEAASSDFRADGLPVRCFRGSPVIPDSSWTILYDGSSIATGAGIFHNATLGLISISDDGTTWYTIQDKNLGATTVYNDGDTLTQANMGNMYQWGNNYGFPSTGTITNTSSTQVDASGYGPGNYYESSTFIIGDYDWSSVHNDNLRGGESQGELGTITNTGVISVNGQTGDVTVSEFAPTSSGTTNQILTKTADGYDWTNAPDSSNTKTFYLSSTSDLTNAQAALDWYNAGKNPLLMYDSHCYSLDYISPYQIVFVCSKVWYTHLSARSLTSQRRIFFDFSSNTVTNISIGELNALEYLDTSYNYSTPYTPTYDGSPTTKKYVDDRDVYIGTSEPTSNKVEGRLWYDTTNDILKAYDGTQWNATGTTYTAGSKISIANNVISVNGETIYVGSTGPSQYSENNFWFDTTDGKLKVFYNSVWTEVGAGSGDMLYADFNWVAKTGETITLDLNSTITPSANFTVNAPSTIKDGQIYILRVISGATAYTMTLGTGITNPYSTSTTLTANCADQFVFQAIGGNLELLPDSDVVLDTQVDSSSTNGITNGAITTYVNGTKQDKTITGSVAPSSAPQALGQFYLNTTSGDLYIATGTTSSADWKAVGGGNVIAMSQSEYNALSTAEKNDGKLRIITDAPTEDISVDWTNVANKPSDLTAAQIQAGSSTTAGMVAPSVISASMPILSTQTGNASNVKIWVGSQSDYEALATKDPNTLYFTTNVVSGS